MGYDAKQRFIALVPGGNGVIFAIQADGSLLWYQNTGWAGGSAAWAPASGSVIGTGWHEFTTVLAAGDGQLFGVKNDGTLLWYKLSSMNANTGAHSWAANSGTRIGSGFNRYTRLIGGWNGMFYALDASGDMYFYYYSAGNGSPNWANGRGTHIGSGFNQLIWLWADPDGVVFGVRQSAVLSWWHYRIANPTTGAGSWANGGNGIDIGDGWGDTTQRTAFSNTGGVVYTVQLDGSDNPGTDNVLAWYRLQNSQSVDTSGVSWANGGNAANVGSGWTYESFAALQGYPSAQSAPQGGSVGIQVSTTWPTYTATVVRAAPAPAAGAPVTVIPAASHNGTLKTLPSTYRSTGCAWSTDFSVAVGAAWPSGIYGVQLVSPAGTEQDVMFVVRPSAPQNKIAVVVPTNTYNAYNSWGGHDQYTNGQSDTQRIVTTLRPSHATAFSATGAINHTLYSDLLLLTWMTANGIDYDVYTDLDVDTTGTTWMPAYKAVVLASHPEYWSQTARANLILYLAGGGRVVATGGNCIYEQVSYSTDRTAVVFRTTTGERNLFENVGEYESDILGIDYNPASYLDFFPYQVVSQHPFLDGTGLTYGDTFGAAGYNVAASGWEVDWATSGITGLVVIAEGLNPNGGGSMCYLPYASGGWVFSTGSISFNGSIGADAAIPVILGNVFAAAVL